MAWISFGALPCRGKKKLDDSSRLDVEIARVAWHASFQPLCNKKRLAIRHTHTDPSFQRHYRFRPTISGSRSGEGLISTPSCVPIDLIFKSPEFFPPSFVLYDYHNKGWLFPYTAQDGLYSGDTMISITTLSMCAPSFHFLQQFTDCHES